MSRSRRNRDKKKSRTRKGSVLALFVFVSVILSACKSETAAPPLNIVLVMVDTLRADRMGLYGADVDTTPNIDRLAKQAVVFDSASSDAGCTFPSVNSIFTSRWPHRQISRLDEVGMAIPDDVPTLARVLVQNGYDTAAVSSSIIVRKTPSKINLQGGFDAGFEAFDESCLDRGAPCVNRQAFGQLDELREPFLLYLHYLEPHAPYRPPRWFEKKTAVPPNARRWAQRGDLGPLFALLYEEGDGPPVGEVELDLLARLYDEEIRFFDSQFQVLMDDLQSRGLMERTVVVLLSDHGEELMDHGHAGHCRDLAFETLLHVPLVIWLPGGEKAGRRSSLVQNIDLMPTLLELVGVEYKDLALDGLSLQPTIESDRPVRRYVSSLQGISRTLRTQRWKLIYDIESGRRSLFDLASDAIEGTDVEETQPEMSQRLSGVLERLLEQIESGESVDAVGAADRVEEQLKQLGYL